MTWEDRINLYSTVDEMASGYAAVRSRIASPLRIFVDPENHAKPKGRVVDLRPKWRAPVVTVFMDWSRDDARAERATDGDVLLKNCPPLDRILRQVAHKHHVTVHDMRGPWRAIRITRARQEAMWRIRMERFLSYPAIGRLFGGRDHTTAMSAVRRHQRRIDEGEFD